jgi:hypothetical protein
VAEEKRFLDRLHATSDFGKRDKMRRRWERQVIAPRYAQRALAVELQLHGLEQGRRKGSKVAKTQGDATPRRIQRALSTYPGPVTSRGLAAKIAAQIGVERSTVARHLKALSKT